MYVPSAQDETEHRSWTKSI